MATVNRKEVVQHLLIMLTIWFITAVWIVHKVATMPGATEMMGGKEYLAPWANRIVVQLPSMLFALQMLVVGLLDGLVPVIVQELRERRRTDRIIAEFEETEN